MLTFLGGRESSNFIQKGHHQQQEKKSREAQDIRFLLYKKEE